MTTHFLGGQEFAKEFFFALDLELMMKKPTSARLIQRSSVKDDTYDYLVKLVIVGEPSVGKSSVLGVLNGEAFSRTREATIGIEFSMLRAIGDPIEPASSRSALLSEGHNPRIHPTHYKVQTWDCAGQIRFRSIVRSYFRGAHGIIAVFSLNDRESFNAVPQWINEVREQLGNSENLVFGLIGNKCDLNNIVTQHEIDDMVDALRFDFYEAVSAATGRGLESAINAELSTLHHRVIDGSLTLQHLSEQNKERSGSFRLISEQKRPSSPSCTDCF